MEEFLQDTISYFLNNPIEVLGFVFGVACVVLNALENIWAWPTGLISVFAYTYIFWDAHLYGDFGLHIIYIVLGIYGWYNWLYGGKEQDELPITYSSKKELLTLLPIGIICTGLVGYYLDNYTNDPAFPYWDATTTVFSLIAQYQLTQKKIENWLLWIFVDLLCVFIYYYKGLYITTGLYFIYLFLATAGYLHWKKLERQAVGQ